MTSRSSDQPFRYHTFHHVWNIVGIEDRPTQACQYCRRSHAKCNGKMPCQRCQYKRKDCVYQKPEPNSLRKKRIIKSECDLDSESDETEEENIVKMEKNVLVLEKAMDELKVEFEIFTRKKRDVHEMVICQNSTNTSQNSTYFKANAGSDEEDTQAKSESVLTKANNRDGKKLWIIKKTKSGMAVQFSISNVYQLYELLVRLCPNEIHRQPATTLPVGTMVMMCSSTAQWPKWHYNVQNKLDEYTTLYMSRYQPLKVNVNTKTRFVFTPELEEIFLDAILVQSAECGSWNHNRFSERFLACKKTYRSQSPHCMAHCYAIGAFNALHVLEHHLGTIKLDLPVDFNTTESAQELSARYFNRAHDLLIDQILESEPEDLSVDLVDALFFMFRYLVDGGSDRHDLAATYLSMALRVAAQLDYHKALRGTPIRTMVNYDEFENAIKWNLLTSTDQCFKLLSGRPSHTTYDDSCLNILGVAIRVPPSMPQDKLQRFQESFYKAKHSAICRDFFNTMWADDAVVTMDKLEPFLAAFARWESELPHMLRLDARSPKAFASRSSFLLALNLHIKHQASIIDLYYPFCPYIHKDPFALTIDMQRGCSDAAFIGTHLMFALMRAGCCSFPFNNYQRMCQAHVWLATYTKDKEVRKRNRGAVLRAARIVKGMGEYRLGKVAVVGLVMKLELVAEEQKIAKEEEGEVFGGEEEYFVPTKMPGVGW